LARIASNQHKMAIGVHLFLGMLVIDKIR
jgi:hypothetical protein